jgi:PHD/YefM family antitoxin component YafN of YafNO toxin-antitoxin module
MSNLPDEIERGENVNLLSEAEWRMIHNALAVYRTQTRASILTERLINLGDQIQQLMDKVRDNYIASYETN